VEGEEAFVERQLRLVVVVVAVTLVVGDPEVDEFVWMVAMVMVVRMIVERVGVAGWIVVVGEEREYDGIGGMPGVEVERVCGSVMVVEWMNV